MKATILALMSASSAHRIHHRHHRYGNEFVSIQDNGLIGSDGIGTASNDEMYAFS